MRSTALLALAALLAAGACARAYPPPGGERDVTPPRLVGTEPEALAVLPGYAGAAVFRFDERLSERGFSESLVLVSPLDGAVRVSRGRTEVRVTIDGGWRPDRVYRVTLLPGVRDLFGNPRTASAELVFSTGPPIPETAIAGIVLDRVSGAPAPGSVVNATRRADAVMYVALADSGGFFSLRHLPLGVYDMRAYADPNRNRRRDALEAVDSGRIVSLGAPADTQTVVFSVLAPDTTPPRVTSAALLDSARVRVTFDEHLLPEQPLGEVRARVLALPDSTPFASAVRVEHPATAGVPGVVRPPAGAAAADATPPPARELVVTLERPLEPGRSYVIIVENAANLHGLRGGGSASFEVRAAPTLPPVRRDTAAAHIR